MEKKFSSLNDVSLFNLKIFYLLQSRKIIGRFENTKKITNLGCIDV